METSGTKFTLPHNCNLLDNQCRLRHSDKDWVSTRPPVPGSNSLCIRPDNGSNVCFQHPDTGLNSCTTGSLQHLQSTANNRLLECANHTPDLDWTYLKIQVTAHDVKKNNCTLPFGCNLTRHTWDVTVQACPPSLTLAGVRGPLLPAGTSIFTGGGVTPAYKVL